MENYSTREQIVELVNRLFVYTDRLDWEGLQNEVFTASVWFDASSLGGEPAQKLRSAEICNMWAKGFEGLDAVNHLAGNYLITIDGDHTDIDAYATATHYKQSATQGQTRTFVGTYKLKAEKTEHGWRLNQFVYHLKYMQGNVALN